MSSLRRTLGFSITLLVLASALPATGSAGFGDVPSGTYFEAPVQWMVDNEITLGTEPGCFSPWAPVTRGQAAAFLWRMEGEPDAPGHSFEDVSGAWLDGAVAWMAHQEITLGVTETTFEPNSPVTRGQIAAFLHRLAGKPVAADHAFTDITQPWQQAPVAWMAELEITTGTTATTFDPDAIVTRGQVAAFLYRYQGEPEVAIDPTSPSCGGDPQRLVDDFDSGPADLLAGSASDWQVYNGAAAERIDIDSSTPGSLVIVGRQTFHNGWYATNEGPFVYQEIDGDFAFAISLTVVSADEPSTGEIPGAGFNSGGFVVRDPDSAHDWVMYNMGNQEPGFGYGREVKTTVGGSSVLNLYDQVATTHRLMVCRVGSEVHYFHGAYGGSEWTEEVLWHNRPDFGDTLQVGFIANAWEGDPQAWVEIHEVISGIPTSVSGCADAIGL